MATADFNPQCDRIVRISLKDYNGPLAAAFIGLPDDPDHPNVCVASCYLAERHDGRCEWFVDGEPSSTGKPYQGYWITWQGHPHRDDDGRRIDSPAEYQWITNPDTCPTDSPNGSYACSRYMSHTGGHSFTTFIAS